MSAIAIVVLPKNRANPLFVGLATFRRWMGYAAVRSCWSFFVILVFASRH
jgi:hypothetical protein